MLIANISDILNIQVTSRNIECYIDDTSISDILNTQITSRNIECYIDSVNISFLLKEYYQGMPIYDIVLDFIMGYGGIF